MSGRFQKRFMMGMALAATLVSSLLALADSTGPMNPFPITGAYSAHHREDRDHVSVIEIAGNYDQTLSNGVANPEPRAVIAREFFRTHPDNYDFLVAFSTFEFDTGDATAFHWAVQNKVQGIGIREFDNSALFGSNGKLLGFIDMAALTRHTTDPLDPDFETTLGVLAHEVLHQWGPRVRFKQGDAPASDALLGRGDSHWSYLLDSDASVQYGANWRDNGDGTFTSVGIRKFFSPLDLYLMGIYKPEEVPPFFLIENTSVSPDDLPKDNVTITGTKRIITVDDIIAAEGMRVPSAQQSQKDFRIGFILLVGPNEEVSEAQIAALNNVRRAFMTRFAILTGGRAVAQVYPEAMPTETTGAPTPIDGGELRNTPASLEEGLTWLRNRQNGSGSWSDRDATAVRDTAVTLGTLMSLDPSFNNASAALQWLNENPAASVDYLARHARLLKELGGDAAPIHAQLATLQNSDGGWGIARGYNSNPLDTALAVLALVDSSHTSALDKAAQYLVAKQNTDGGWSTTAGSPSRTTATTTVLRALQALGRQATAAPNALAWLKAKQNADGGFGDSPSTVHDTANVLQALMSLDALAEVRAESAATYLLSRQTTSGSWEGSVYATASAVGALKRFNFPNWTVTAISATPNNPRDGERVQISITVKNDSALVTPAGVLRVYDGDPANGGTQIGSDLTVPVLAPGLSVSFSPMWDTLNKTGAHTLVAVVDPNDAQTEMSERDNRASTAITVLPAPPGVDLTFATPDVTVSPAQPNRLPTTLGISVSVRNIGLTDAHNVRVLLWAGPIGSTLAGEVTLDVLNRSTVMANYTYVLTKPGTIQFTAQIDPDNALPEANEGNNTALATATTVDSVDLALVAADISVDRSPAVVGEDVIFTVRFRNQGTVDAPSTQVSYVVTDGNVTRELRTNTIQLDAGETTEQSIPWRVDLSGSLTFTARLDPSGLVPELDEANNAASLTVNAGSANGPNLVVSYQDFTLSPNPGHEGYSLTLAALVRNTGTTAVTNAEIAFYNGDPAQGGVQIGELQTIPTLAPGASVNLNITWPTIPDSTDKLLFVVADPRNQIAEFSEADNTAFNVLPVLSLPDLAIAAGDIQLSPPFPKTGDAVTVAVRVANLGAQTVSNIVVRAYDGDPAAGGTPIGTDQTIATLNGFGFASVSFPWTSLSAADNRAIYVQVDPANAVLERTKTNNVARRDVTVQNGDFYVTNKYFSPDNNGVKDSTEFSFRLPAVASVSVEIVDKRDNVVRRFSGAGLTNIAGGSVLWDGLDTLGRVVPDGDYRLRVVGSDSVTLGETSVRVDNNRSSLLEAEGTPYQSFINLSCELPSINEGRFRMTNDDSKIFFSIDSGRSPAAVYPVGLYRMEGDGTDIRAIIPESFFASTSTWAWDFSVTPDGTKVALVRRNFSVSTNQVWIADGDGRNLRSITVSTPIIAARLSHDGAMVYVVSQAQDRILAYPVSGGAPTTLYTGHVAAFSLTVSPDGRKLSFFSLEDTEWKPWILDPVARTVVAPLGNDLIGDVNLVWSPNGAYFTLTDGARGRILVFDQNGVLRHTVVPPLPTDNDGIEVGQPTWSSTSTEFAFDSRPYDTDVDDVEQGGIYVFNLTTGNVEKVAPFLPIPEDDNQNNNIVAMEVSDEEDGSEDTDEVPGIHPGGELYWVPGERSLLYRDRYSTENEGLIDNGFSAILLDDGNQQKLVFTEGMGPNPSVFMFSPTGRQLLFSAWLSPRDGSTCDNRNIWAYRSLLNLTADLRATRSAQSGGVQLKGTAADLNFSSYTLDYATSATPQNWNPIMPASGQPVVDELFGTWVPPAPGTYFVRLTAQDLAGNTRQTIKRVGWGDTPSITDVYRTPAFISPNGDGTSDQATIHYRVLEPVHLTFAFYDVDGDRVRTITRDHTLIGEEVNLLWDGRDDNGVPVTDGIYRMTVQNYEFFVNVDATVPAATISTREAYQFATDANGEPTHVVVNPGIDWHVVDANLSTAVIETGNGTAPTAWVEDGAVTACNFIGTPPPPTEAGCVKQVPLALFASSRLRVNATDTAGNRAVAVAPLPSEQLIVSRFGTHTAIPCKDDSCAGRYKLLDRVAYAPMSAADGADRVPLIEASTARLTVAETIRRPLAQVYIQYRKSTQATWQEAAVASFYRVVQERPDYDRLESADAVVDHQLAATWNMSGIEPGETYIVRLRAIDTDGVSHHSNAFRFKSEGLTFNGLVDSGDEMIRVAHLLAGAPLEPDEYVLWAEELIAEPIQSARLFLRSDEDPRYAVSREVGVVAFPQSVFIYRTTELQSCKTYYGKLEAVTQPRVNPVTGEVTQRTLTTEEIPVRMPCVTISASAQTVPAGSCDAPSKQQIMVTLTPVSLDDSELKLLTLSRRRPDGSDDVLFNVNKPQGTAYQHAVDTSTLAEGTYELFATVINVNDEKASVPVTLIVDHTPPVARLTYPLEGQRLCAIPKQAADGKTYSMLTVEGELRDTGGLDYLVEYSTGGSDAFVTQHDSVCRDSFEYPVKDNPNCVKPKFGISTHAGPVAALYDVHGDVSVRLRAMDRGGFERCEVKTFSVDGMVDGPFTSIDRVLFSPNDDGELDSVELTYGTDEAVIIDIDVYAAVRGANGSFVTTGDTLRRLMVQSSILSGRSTLTWDGRATSGAVVADGWYGIVVAFKDGCGNVKTLTRYVEVDNTPPAVELLYPKTGDALPMIVEVQGSVNDLHLQYYAVDFGVSHAPETWARLAGAERNAPVTQVLGVWNTFGLDGPHTVRVIAADTVGNRRVIEVPVNLVTRTNLIGYLEATPELFSPNADGKRDGTGIRFGLENDARVTVKVFDHTDAERHVLTTDQPFAKGAAVLTWDGTNGTTVLPDGTYSIELTAALASNTLIRQQEKVSVVLDRTPPTIEVSRPADGFVSASGSIVGTIRDERMGEYSVAITSNPAAPNWELLETGTDNRVNAAFGSLEDRAEGEYALKIEAKDQAETLTRTILPFVIDTTAPKVTLKEPAAGAVVGQRKAPINVTGTVEEKYLRRYTLNVGLGAAPTEWTELASGTTLPLPDVIHAWNVGALADGTYTLQLRAEDKAGLVGESRVTLVVDNTAPTTAVTTPSDGGYVTKPIDIVGAANDPNFAEYTLEVATGEKGASSRWSKIGSATQAVNDSVLLEWQALPPDGVHTLRLTAKDAADNIAETLTQVTVDTRPPAAPTNLAGAVENGSAAHLTWAANTETDLAGYAVYRAGVRITPELLTTTDYLDSNLLEGRYTYTVTAFDKAGWESVKSAEISVVMDVTPPTTQLATPSDSATVSGLLDVVGTAHSTDDFKEYRFYIGQGASPSDYQLVRRSPVPILGDVLLQWNTVALAEGTLYTLKLEAEDINGNVASDQVTVRIDNLPPAAPTGLSAIPNGANVQLNWNANTEADLFGYLVFRDERLANLSGVLVGNLKPYAVTNRSYLDAAVADGRHTYYVVAIDAAGNTSDPSAVVPVSIDTRTPKATIAPPAPSTRFDQALYVLATSADTDIAQVQLQYRRAGDSGWTTFVTDTSMPYEGHFDPATLALDFGDYELRAVATDQTNKTDTAPSAVTVTYTDVTRPNATLGVTGSVDGGTVSLTWTANSDADIAGYHVERMTSSGALERLTSTPVAVNIYTDEDLDDDTYSYTVTAIDSAGNEADPSAATIAVVYTPTIEHPYTPTRELNSALTGQGRTAGTVSASVSNTTSGTVSLPSVLADTDGRFAIANIPLSSGENTIALRLTDNAGNISKIAQASVIVGTAPSKPTGLAVTADGYDVTLSWNTNPEANIAGYRILRNGQSIDDVMTDVEATASSWLWWAPPEQTIDRDENSYWSPVVSDELSPIGQSIQWSWSEARVVTQIQLQWASQNHAAVDFDVDAWTGNAWVTIARVRDNEAKENTFVLAQPYRTTSVRAVLRRINEVTDEGPDVLLGEFTAHYMALVPETTYLDYAEDGVYDYAITAVNELGFESMPSDSVRVSIGDVVAPEPVILTAETAGSDVTLRWSASTSDDVSHYDIYRDGNVIATQDATVERVYVDAARSNGVYTYVVKTVDQRDNVSVPSNEAAATVLVATPSAPANLAISVVPAGRALDVSWDAVANAAGGYRLLRATVAGGPYTAVADTADTQRRDTGLTNGVTYFYVVVALDAAGNASAHSNEASGTPSAIAGLAIQLHSPTRPGEVYTSHEPTISIVGRTDPGASVTLLRNGVALGQTQAQATSAIERVTLADAEDARLSPDGRYVIFERNVSEDSEQLALYDVAAQTITSIGDPADSSRRPVWTPDGSEILFYEDNDGAQYVRAYHVANQTFRNVTDPVDHVDFFTLSPNGQQLAIFGLRNGEWQSARVDMTSGAWLPLIPDELWAYDTSGWSWSPDGTRLIYYRYTDDTLAMLHVPTGNVQAITGQSVNSDVSWSPDGGMLLYTVNGDETSSIWRYRLTDGDRAQLVNEPNWPWRPVWSPDGRAIAYSVNDDNFENEFLRILDIAHGDITTIPMPNNVFIESLDWSSAGYLSVALYDETENWWRISPPGRVAFNDVPLLGGDNIFGATATDMLGNDGVAESIVVNYNTGDRIDLGIRESDLRILPAAPGRNEVTRVTVTVRNIGTRNAASAAVSLFAIDPQGDATTLLDAHSLGPIAAGETRSASADWTVGASAGDYTLIAIADPANDHAEITETNNVVVRTLPVAPEGGITFGIATDKPVYLSGDSVTAAATLTNSGDTYSGRLEIAIEDQAGYPVQQLLTKSLTDVRYGASITERAVWPTGSTFAGLYQVRARLFNNAGQQIAESLAPFEITAASQLSGTVTASRAVYVANEPVRIDGEYRYVEGNSMISGAEAILRVLNADMSVLAEARQPIGDILPGAAGALSLNWNTGTTPVGQYRATLLIVNADTSLAAAETVFEITAGSAQLSGTLSLSEQAPAPGMAQIVTYTVTNNGNASLTQLPVRVRLLDPALVGPVDVRNAAHDVTSGGSASGSISFDTTALALKTYTVVFEADVPAMTGTSTVTLATAAFRLTDRAPPTVTLRQPAENGYLRSNTKATVFAVDALSSVKSVEISIDGGPWIAAPIHQLTESLYGELIGNLADGTHTIAARASDAWNNIAEADPLTFVVDSTAPVISIQGVANDGIYNSDAVAQINATDANLDSVITTLNGASYASGTPITSDGEYTLAVTALDKAGNTARTQIQFTVDKAGPQIVVTGVEDGGSYRDDVSPTIQITDPQLAESSITLNGQAFVSGTAISAEGPYELMVTARDQSNNTATVMLRFVIDKTPPQILVSGVQDGSYYTGNVTPTIQISDAHLRESLITLNGEPYVSGTPVVAEANHELIVTASDQAGNAAMVTVRFVIDRTAPVVIVTQPIDGSVTEARAVDVRGTTEPGAQVQLAAGAYQANALADALGNFAMLQVPLVDGDNSIHVFARDHAGNNGPTVQVRVRVAHDTQTAELKGEVISAGRVLVWLPKKHSHHCSNCDRYDVLAALFEATLTRDGVDYLVVRQESDFLAALRSRRYTTLALAEIHSSDGGGVLHMEDATSNEIRATVASGVGIVWIKTHPNNKPLDALFGVKPNGTVPHLSRVELPQSAASAAGIWSVDGKGMRMKLAGGNAVGLLQSGNHPAIVLHQFGDGRTAMLGFDPSQIEDAQGAIDTLSNVLRYAVPPDQLMIPGGVVEVRWTASQLTPPLGVRLRASLPEGMSFVAAIDGNVLSEREADWRRDLTSDTAEFRALVRLPDAHGGHEIIATLYDTTISETLLAETTLLLAIERDREELGTQLESVLSAMSVGQKYKHQLASAIEYVKKATARPQHAPADTEYSIFKLLLAQRALLEIPEVPASTYALLGRTLGVYQALWREAG